MKPNPNPPVESFSFRLLDGGRGVVVFDADNKEVGKVNLPSGNAIDHRMATQLAEQCTSPRQFLDKLGQVSHANE